MSFPARRPRSAIHGLLIAAGLGAATIAAWWALYRQQSAMDALPMDRMWMPPTGARHWSLTDFALTASMWWIMMLAMMLPVVTPMALLVARIDWGRTSEARIRLPAFLLGYLMLWLGFGLVATLLQWQFHRFEWLTPMMNSRSSAVSAAILIAAGCYQFTPWKIACLNHCRAPMGFLLAHGRPGWIGGLRLGLHHGFYCIGCCWAEMLVMFAVGVMNVLWMALITLAILAERYVPGAHAKIRKAIGIGLIAWGGTVALI